MSSSLPPYPVCTLRDSVIEHRWEFGLVVGLINLFAEFALIPLLTKSYTVLAASWKIVLKGIVISVFVSVCISLWLVYSTLSSAHHDVLKLLRTSLQGTVLEQYLPT